MKNCVFCGKRDWLLVAYFCFLSHREKEIETPRLGFWKQPARVRSDPAEENRILTSDFWKESELPLHWKVYKTLSCCLQSCFYKIITYIFYMLFQSLCKMIRNLLLEKPDLYFPKWERNLLKYNMSKLNNISNFYLSGYSIDRWSGLQGQTLICMYLHS